MQISGTMAGYCHTFHCKDVKKKKKIKVTTTKFQKQRIQLAWKLWPQQMKLPPMSEPSPAPPSASWTSPPATDAGEMDQATPALMHARQLDTQSEDAKEGCAGGGGAGPGASLEKQKCARSWKLK